MIPARGLKNNNPGNIRHNRDKFQGEVQPSRDAAFKEFTSMAYGYRAMFVTLATYLERNRRDTIEKIVQAWAPPTENKTQAYINTVALFSGVSKNKALTLFSGEDYIRIVAAMSRVENGRPANMADVTAGFGLQDRIRK
jgi:hypothetical protein